jgi:hypothetical protein
MGVRHMMPGPTIALLQALLVAMVPCLQWQLLVLIAVSACVQLFACVELVYAYSHMPLGALFEASWSSCS